MTASPPPPTRAARPSARPRGTRSSSGSAESGTYRENGGRDVNNTVFVTRSGSREGGYIRYSGVRDADGNRPVIESAGKSGFGIQDRQYLIIEGLELRPTLDNPQGLSAVEGGRQSR